MTPNKNEGLIARLTDPDFAGAFQHLRDWRDIDALHEETARAIQDLEAEVAVLRARLRDDEVAFRMIDVSEIAVPNDWRFRCDARKIAKMRLEALASPVDGEG